MASSINASTSGAGGVITTADNTGILNLQTANTNAVTIDASQNVGIGTTSPSQRLDVQAANGANSFWLTSTTGTNPVYSRYSNTGGFLYIGRDGSAGTDFGAGAYASAIWPTGAYPLVFGTNATERMRIDSSGNVGIGTSSPTYKLDISSGSSNTLNITTNNTNTTIFNITRSSVTTVTHTLDSTGYKIINGGSGGLYLGYTGTSWTSLSDERFKTDLKPIENAVEKVSTLRAVTGRFKTDNENKSRAFLIAQDIQAVLPEAVDTSNPEQLGVSYTDTIPLLVAAIKEQQTIINDLKARVTALEAK